MKTISQKMHQFHEYLDSKHFTQLERITIRVIAVTAIINIGIVAIAFRVHFHQIPIVEATAQSVVTTGTSTIGFIHDLGVPDIQAKKSITRKSFSVPGTLLTLKNDNFQIYEYPSIELAAADVNRLKKLYYSKSSEDVEWKKSVHIFQKDQLIIFYMGNNKDVLSTLSSFAGFAPIHTFASNMQKK